MVAEPRTLLGRLRSGPALVGTFLQAPSPVTAELVAGLGVDFTCVEAGHSAIGVETMQALVAASALGGAPALVRVRQNTAAEIAAALDAGLTAKIAKKNPQRPLRKTNALNFGAGGASGTWGRRCR